jgi:hypothetical protein
LGTLAGHRIASGEHTPGAVAFLLDPQRLAITAAEGLPLRVKPRLLDMADLHRQETQVTGVIDRNRDTGAGQA